jgi:hypothetical protein
MILRNSCRLLFLIGLLILLVTSGFAQFRGSIRGVVSDSQGAVLPGTSVTLTNTDTNATMTAVSDDNGIYVFNALPNAHYQVSAEHSGFKKKVLEHVQIIPDQPNALNLQMEVGQVQDSVTVSGTTETLNTETASTSGTIRSSEVKNMPSFGRDVFKLVQLAPGVFGDNSQGSGGGGNNLPGSQGPGATGSGSNQPGIFQTENGPQAVVGGQSYMNNSYNIDGVSTTSAVWGGTTIITPSEESVQDVKVVSNTYDAENGRFSGAQVQVTTKSGTNQVHGSAFFNRHTPGLNAYQRWNGNNGKVLRDDNIYSQYGGSVGAPIWRNKVFGFFAWETLRSPKGQVNHSSHWYETSSLASAAASGSIASKYLGFAGSRPNSTSINSKTCTDIGLVEGVNCQTIAGQGLDIGSPLTSGLGTQDLGYQNSGHPGVGSGLDGIADIANYNTTSQSTYTNNQYIGRLDANVTTKDRLSFSIYDTPKSGTSQAGDRPYGSNFRHNESNNAYTVIWNRVISPNFVNEARANAAGWRWNEGADNPQLPIGLPQAAVSGIGNITLTNYGSPYFSHLDQWTYSYKDVATWVHGRHTIKFGGELTRLYYLQQNAYNAIPSYTFYNIWDFVNDAPEAETAIVNPATGAPTPGRQDQRQNIWGFFVQDDLKVRRNLTINVGLRWNYFAPLYSKQNNMYRAVPGAGTAFLSDLTVQKKNLADAQKNNFGPQVGFAWSPTMFNDKLVVRGGYGLSFNQSEIAITANISNNPGLVVSQSLNSASPSSINPNIVYGVASDIHSLNYPANPAFVTTLGSNGLPTNGASDIFIFPQTMPTTRVQHWSLDTQYEFMKNWIAMLGYQGSHSSNLLFNAQIGPYAASKGYAPPNPHINYTGWDNYWNQNGYGNYNALLTEVKHTFGHGLLFDVQYTWSKTLDTSTGPYSEQPFPGNPSLDYGLSDNDVRNAWKIYGSYSPTFFNSGNQLMKTMLGGWTISGIFNIHSGFPWSPVFNINGSPYCGGCWYGSLYPGAYKGGAGSSTSNDAFKSGSNYANGGLAYFSAPTYTSFTTLGQWGSPATNPVLGMRRNSLTGPGYRSVDMTLVKAFAVPANKVLGESGKFVFRADAYNLFNNLNINPGSIDKAVASWNSGAFVSNSNFGRAGSALGARVVTMGLRFEF